MRSLAYVQSRHETRNHRGLHEFQDFCDFTAASPIIHTTPRRRCCHCRHHLENTNNHRTSNNRRVFRLARAREQSSPRDKLFIGRECLITTMTAITISCNDRYSGERTITLIAGGKDVRPERDGLSNEYLYAAKSQLNGIQTFRQQLSI